MGVLFSNSSFAALCEAGDDRLGLDKYNGALHSFVCNVEHCCVRGVGEYEDHACMKFDREPAWEFTQQDQVVEDHDMTKYPDLAKEGATSLDEIRQVHLTTMDQNMNCSVNRMKYQLNREMISGEVLDGRKLSDPIVTSLEALNEALLEKIKSDGCLEPTDDGDVRQQNKMADALMYEQCVYHYYLLYYKNAVQKNIGYAFASKDPNIVNQVLSGIFGNAAYAATSANTAKEIAEAVRALDGKISAEQSISRRTLGDAMDLHANIPQSYVPYTLLKILEMQVVEIRTYMHIYLRAIAHIAEFVQNSQKEAS